MMKEKLAIIYGTRPEFLKVYPLILEAQRRGLYFITINTGQHADILSEMERLFDFVPDYQLKAQSLDLNNSGLFAKLTDVINEVVRREEVTGIFAQGDTFTVLAAAIVSFLERKSFYHIEAGLRTDHIYFPFPEEFNRRVVSMVSNMNFAPTQLSKINLLKECIDEDKIIVTGNTIIDLLQYVLSRERIEITKRNIVFITVHRRENIGENLVNICSAIRELANENPRIQFYWILHPNPAIKAIIDSTLGESFSNIEFLKPLNYIESIKIMAMSLMIISDSGGIQEEAPSLQKKVLILREETERPEVIACGCGVLVGNNISKIKAEFYKELLNDQCNQFVNPFGDGKAAIEILDAIDIK